MNKIKVGGDPEMFVSDGINVVHAIGKIGGTKGFPVPVNKGGLEEDNVLAEITFDAADNPEDFLENIRTVMHQLSERLRGVRLQVVPDMASFVYNPEVLNGFPEEAFVFGCTPDFDAFSNTQNPSPEASSLLRTAGGHVHIGYEKPSKVTSRKIALMCDYLLGLPSVLEDVSIGAERRKELYGKASCIRYKPYGVEYRTLSNYWIWSDALVKVVHERATLAALNYKMLPLLQSIVPQEEVRRIINENDKVSAQAVLTTLKAATNIF